ncbi:BCL2 modifying factor 1 [Paramisgurnus dabryanus]|uniref:BCL2 modifying factor 1 n=1 Tax=Paramisgurnus dabryanus TaxID=90735 RepID=UPI003CCFCA7F
MDEDDDDVFRKGRQCWPSSHHQIKTADRGLHSSGLPPASSNSMLSCRIRNEHRRLLYASEKPEGPRGILVACAAGDLYALVRERGGWQEGRPTVSTPSTSQSHHGQGRLTALVHI